MVSALAGRVALVRRTKVARGLIARADVARDARRYEAAAALYREGLRLGPDSPRIRIQLANMLKDAGDLADAHDQYLLARERLPSDPDLAMQIGHVNKLMGDMSAARESYRLALTLRPGWAEAQRELAGLPHERADRTDAHQAALVPELLPRSTRKANVRENPFRLFQFGRVDREKPDSFKLLRGVEAIRGYWISAQAVERVQLLVDDVLLSTERPVTYARANETPPGLKYTFNLWCDFSAIAPGPHRVRLTFLDRDGRILFTHHETMRVEPAVAEQRGAASDAWIPPIPGVRPLPEEVNALPSVLRSVHRQLLPEAIKTVLVQRADQLGDLVCSVPAIRRLRALFPAARIVGLVTPANEALARSLHLFDELLTVDFAEHPAEGRRTLDAPAQARLQALLAPYAFDLAIDLGEGDDSRPLLRLSGARFLYGFRHRHFPWLDAGLDFGTHDPINGNDIIPPSRKFMLLIDGLAALLDSPAQAIPNSDRAGLANLSIAPGDRYAVLHAGARLFFSRWPFFDTLARMILERTGLKVILLSTDSALAGFYPDRLHIIPGQLPFAELDALLSHCALFVGNDSGPKHLAALRGAPVVSVHIPRNNWSEWGQEISGTVITRRVPCAGCGIAPDGEDCGKDFACIRNVDPEEVFRAAAALLDRVN